MNKSRKIDTLISTLCIEGFIANLPTRIRHYIADYRYGWLNWLKELQGVHDEHHGLGPMEDLGTIFIHVPKAAGVSVSKTAFGNYGASHVPLFMYLALYGATDFDKKFKFSFVRHPFDRTVSAFNFLKNGGMTESDKIWSQKNLFLYDDVNDFIHEEIHKDEINKFTHFINQSYFLVDPRSKLIGVDFLGKFENLNADFNFVCQNLGIKNNLRHLNKNRSMESNYLSAESKKILENIYEMDMNNFNY